MAAITFVDPTQAPGVRQDDLEQRRRALAQRLEDGYRRIDQAVEFGADVDAWESFWITLLREYEGVCQELRAA